MRKEYRKLSELKAWDKNPRTISKEAYERLKWQIEKLGEYKPLLVNQDNIVLGGNMRLKAYTEMGKDKLWVSPVVTKNEAEMWEYALSDNDHVGVTDIELVINAMPQLDIDWSKYSVDTKPAENLQDLIDKFASDIEEDEAPAVSEGEPVSKLGEVYQLGKHRLMCGDATKLEDIEKLMNGQKVNMVFTDPPYNVNWDYRGKFKERGLKPIFNDNLKEDEWDNFCNNFISNMLSVMKDGAVYYMCSGWHSLSMFEKHLFLNKAKQRQLIIWAKNQFVMGKQSTDYHRQHEQLWYGWKEGAAHHWYGGHKESDLWAVKKVHNLSMVHSTEKPVALSFRAIKNSSKQGGIILDLFGGSGSTLIACEQLNRTCYMMEIDPRYCDVIRKRFDNFKNKE